MTDDRVASQRMQDDGHGPMRRPRLLILDDELATGETIRHIAQSAGFEAVHTTEPGTFLALVRDWTPEVIALDLIMPEMDGVEVIRQLAQSGCRASLIITSGVGHRILDAAERSAQAHGLNIAGVLPKPFRASLLRELLGRGRETVSAAAQASHPPPGPDAAAAEVTAQELRQALQQKAIQLVYQPKIDCRTGVLVGFEALARWQHADKGAIGPDAFIPLAEQAGLIDALTEQVADQALHWLAGLGSAEHRRRCDNLALDQAVLSLNISARSLEQRALFERLHQRCRDLQLEPSRIVLEITESSAMQDPTTALDNLTQLRLKGFHLSIDDFGTGYSSMVQLVRLPFSEIKVDKRFVINAAESAESRAIIRSVVDLGQSLGMRVTAEGVENADTLEYLRELQCDYAQGYHIARPLPADAVLDWFIEREQGRESDRLTALHALHLLDTPPDHRFDRITRLCRQLFGVPTALISLVDENRQWFKSRSGLEARETPRTVSFCSRALEQAEPLVVTDARKDRRFRDNPLVTAPPGIRFYAGQPISLPGGEPLGTLCLIDYVPRTLTARDLDQLGVLARLAEQEILASRPHEAQNSGICDHDTLLARIDSALALCDQLALQAIAIRITPVTTEVQDRDGPSPESIAAYEALVTDTLQVADVVGWLDDEQLLALILGADRYTATEALTRLAEAMNRWNRSHDREQPPIECQLSAERLPGNRHLCALDALRRASLVAEIQVSR